MWLFSGLIFLFFTRYGSSFSVIRKLASTSRPKIQVGTIFFHSVHSSILRFFFRTIVLCF